MSMEHWFLPDPKGGDACQVEFAEGDQRRRCGRARLEHPDDEPRLCHSCSMCSTLRGLLLLIPKEPKAVSVEELRRKTGLDAPRIGTAIAAGVTDTVIARSATGMVYRRKEP